MSTISIADLKLKVILGTNPWERKIKQTVVVNISFDYNASRAMASDDLKDAVNYKALTKQIIRTMKDSRYFLLEKFCQAVLDIVMENSLINKATVRIDKPHALRFAKSVSVTSTRERHE